MNYKVQFLLIVLDLINAVAKAFKYVCNLCLSVILYLVRSFICLCRIIALPAAARNEYIGFSKIPSLWIGGMSSLLVAIYLVWKRLAKTQTYEQLANKYESASIAQQIRYGSHLKNMSIIKSVDNDSV